MSLDSLPCELPSLELLSTLLLLELVELELLGELELLFEDVVLGLVVGMAFALAPELLSSPVKMVLVGPVAVLLPFGKVTVLAFWTSSCAHPGKRASVSRPKDARRLSRCSAVEGPRVCISPSLGERFRKKKWALPDGAKSALKTLGYAAKRSSIAESVGGLSSRGESRLRRSEADRNVILMWKNEACGGDGASFEPAL